MYRDYDPTFARIAGNIAAGMVGPLSGWPPGSAYPDEFLMTVRDRAILLARLIVDAAIREQKELSNTTKG